MSEDRDKVIHENDEPGTEQDEVEAHRLKRPATDEPAAEGEGDDDVEGHVLKRQQ